MNSQQNIDLSRAQGEFAAAACEDKANKIEPTFSERAELAILEHLKVVHEASGEELTDIAIAKGAKPHDARAFGGVFQRLSRRGVIRTVRYCMRTKGHGTAGGRVWALA